MSIKVKIVADEYSWKYVRLVYIRWLIVKTFRSIRLCDRDWRWSRTQACYSYINKVSRKWCIEVKFLLPLSFSFSLFRSLSSLFLYHFVATESMIFLSSDQYAKYFPPAQNDDERKGLEPGSGKAQNRWTQMPLLNVHTRKIWAWRPIDSWRWWRKEKVRVMQVIKSSATWRAFPFCFSFTIIHSTLYRMTLNRNRIFSIYKYFKRYILCYLLSYFVTLWLTLSLSLSLSTHTSTEIHK